MEVGFLLLCLVARLLYLPPSVCSNEVSSPSFYPRILLVKWSIIKRRQQLLSRVVRILHIQFTQWTKVSKQKYRNYHLINPFKSVFISLRDVRIWLEFHEPIFARLYPLWALAKPSVENDRAWHGLKGSVDITQSRLGYWILPITCTKAISVEPTKPTFPNQP